MQHFLLKLDDFTTHYIIATSTPINFVKKMSLENLPILSLGDLKNIVVENLKIIMNEGRLKKNIKERMKK